MVIIAPRGDVAAGHARVLAPALRAQPCAAGHRGAERLGLPPLQPLPDLPSQGPASAVLPCKQYMAFQIPRFYLTSIHNDHALCYKIGK